MNAVERNVVWVLAGLAGAGVLWFGFLSPPNKMTPVRPVVVPVAPSPKCPGRDCPKQPKPKRPWGTMSVPAVVGQDREPAVDLLAVPSQYRPHNISSKGAGCCTFRSAEYAARWQNVPALFGLPEWMRSQGIAGGGTPNKQADMVKRCAQARNLPVPAFAQYEGSDLSFIELALKTGRLPCITWGGNHMLCCVHLDEQSAAIVDNNAPDRVQWFSRADFKRKHTQGGGGWTFVLLASPPPPPPSGQRQAAWMDGCWNEFPANPTCGKKSCDCGCKDGDPCRCAAVEAKGCPCSPACTCGCKDGLGGGCLCGGGWVAGDDGVEWEYGGVERYTLCGETATRAEIEAALEDDTNKLHLTVVGGLDVERKVVLDALGPDAARYLVQSYSPDDWALRCGFAAAMGATTYLQDRTGKVLLRADSPVGLVEKLRRADPSYQPAADPTGDPASIAGVGQWAKDNPTLALGGVGAAVAAFLLWRSRGGPPAVAPAQQYRPAPQTQAAPDLSAQLARLIQTIETRLPPPNATR